MDRLQLALLLMIDLYPHQEDQYGRVRACMLRKVMRPLVVLSTGGGKTRIATRMCQTSISKGFAPIWFVVHRRELLDQAVAAFAAAGLNVGIVASGYETHGNRLMQVVLINSLPRRKQFLQKPRLIIPDEAHHSVAPKWSEMQADNPQAFYVGLTATPERLDGRGLGTHFSEIVEGPPMRWLIDNGYLADYKIFAPPPTTLDLSKIKHQGGDFNKHEIAERVAKSTIVGDSIAEYRKHAMGTSCIIRSVGVEASFHTAEAFKAAGFVAVHLDAKTPDLDRRRMFKDFKRGEISHLCNVDLFGEGVDIPGVQSLIDLRPTESLTLFLQYIGRMLRPAPGKTHGIYLDQVGNTMRHGMPDEVREWSLEGKRKKKKPAAVFTCKVCYGTFAQPFRVCPQCGEIVSGFVQSRAEPKRVDGELQELNKELLAKSQHGRKYDIARGRAKTLEELIRYGVEKGYAKPERWAHHVFNARQQKRARG
jgi:superfamily II DNA or RNA helicase